ncbi:hypothetical protein FRACA_4650001 [Frankia canadensis]|uniref:PIN like domain-containing protein n=1 Tax=Frankia canadensis TaxID=1836972 RepID=A0A2I2KXR3_9ACTN|nr:PIN-like domain-containing protein [Frankia canadensis]SNQ50449.1 hypothetical protein FRACA_4650001 [Frankia canadensis]SOU57739.1 hypothetical protein FRACA_4650001 [Frankia canadensis]
MRDDFRGWFPLDDTAKKEIYTSGAVVLDANVLLSLYRFSSEARDGLLAALEEVSDRLWIPYQAGLEFHRNRLTALQDARRESEKVAAAIGGAERLVLDAFRKTASRRAIQTFDESPIVASFSALRAEAAKLEDKDSASLAERFINDPILNRIGVMLAGKVGPPFDAAQTAQESERGLERITAEVPPGYSDLKSKGEEKALGDYFIWRQTLDEIAREPRDLLFVTNDQKEDWYLRAEGMTLGPRVELSVELAELCGTRLHLATAQTFMSQAKEYLAVSVSERAIQEAGVEVATTRARGGDRIIRDATVYELLVEAALVDAGANVSRCQDDLESIDLIASFRESSTKRVVIEVVVKYCSPGRRFRHELLSRVPSGPRTVPILVVTNAPLTSAVEEINRDTGEIYGSLMVVTFNGQADGSALRQALRVFGAPIGA